MDGSEKFEELVNFRFIKTEIFTDFGVLRDKKEQWVI